MKIVASPDTIGKLYTKPTWTECYFEVSDVGMFTCWGLIKDRTTDIERTREWYALGEDWNEYNPIENFIHSL